MSFSELNFDMKPPAPLKIDEANIQSWNRGMTLSVMLVEKFEGDDSDKIRIKFRGAYSDPAGLLDDLNHIINYVESSNE